MAGEEPWSGREHLLSSVSSNAAPWAEWLLWLAGYFSFCEECFNARCWQDQRSAVIARRSIFGHDVLSSQSDLQDAERETERYTRDRLVYLSLSNILRECRIVTM